MAYPLPNGKTQFIGATGAPLAGGSVYHYIPGTGTLKATYQDLAATILNLNPVPLDASGEAVIFGTGATRQVVFDSLGNQIWDQVTTVATLADLGGVPLAGGTMTGPLVVTSETNTGAQSLAITPTSDTVATQSSLNVQGTTSQSAKREFLAAFGFTSNTGSSSTGAPKDKVAVFSGVNAVAGTGNVWTIRTSLTMAATAGAFDAVGAEVGLNNNTAERGATLGAPGLVTPVAYGLAITGAGAYRSTAALIITGPGTAIWNRGIVFSSNSISQASIQDLGSDTISYEMQGSHTYGVDMRYATFSASAIRMPNAAALAGRNAGDTLDMKLVQLSGSNYLVLGDNQIAGIVMAYLQASASYANDAAAAAGGVALAGLYRNGSIMMIRVA